MWIASSPWSWCTLIKTIIGQGGWQRFAKEEHFVLIELYSQTCMLTKQHFQFSISHSKLSLPPVTLSSVLVSSHSLPFWVFVLHLCLSLAHTSYSLALLGLFCLKKLLKSKESPNGCDKLSPTSHPNISALNTADPVKSCRIWSHLLNNHPICTSQPPPRQWYVSHLGSF